MSDTVVMPTTVSGRAGIAMLTLKLRSAQQDATRAEAAADAAERSAEHALATADADSSVEQRTRALDAELVAARQAAAALVAAAHGEAAKIAAAMTPPIAAAPPFIAAVPVAAVPDPIAAVPVDAVPEPLAVVVHTAPSPSTAVAVTHSAGFDAEAFATVFATVFAAKFEEHMSARSALPMVMPGYAMVPQMQPKPSFWQHAKHLDVVLIGLAAAIVVTVMFAWMG